MVQRHLKEVAKGHAEATTWEKEEIERLRKDVRGHEARVALQADMAKQDMEAITKGHAELKKLEAQVADHSRSRDEANQALANANLDKEQLVKCVDALRELVGELMASNPEIFGGEVLPQAVAPGEETERAEKFLKALEAKGTSSPRPPAIVRLPLIKEEDKQRLVGASNNLVPRYCGLVEESPPTPLPGIVAAEQGLCEVWTVEETSAPEPVAEAAPAPVAEAAPAPVAEAAPETTRVCCVGCGKPKPNYNHPNWPSPITKRFAKHLAKHSGNTDPKTIRTHEDALEYIAKRANISVETLLQWTMKHFQSFSQPWTLVEGPSKFVMGTAPATWWC
jgi:hypothetical protein